MKKGKTLQQLTEELKHQASAKRDFLMNSRAMSVSNDAESFSIFRTTQSGDESLSFGMTGLFHRQLGASLKIPAKYYDLMQTDYPELLSQNINGWFAKEPVKHTVRTLGGTARAFLSDRYRRIDNIDVAQAVLPIIAEIPGARVDSTEITENRMYLKVINPRLEAEVSKGDVVQAGIVISNSEVGLGSVSVMPLVYRLVCLNGMIVNDMGQRKYHIGRENDEAWELYGDETLAADDAAFMMKLADVVRTAVDEAKFALIVDKLREAADAKITAHVPDVVELTSKQ